jgi:cytochrome P450
MKDPSLLSICGFLGLSYVVWIILKVFGRFVQWYTSPLNQIPGPKSNKSFWLGSFRDVSHEPFMQPHKRWWMEAGVDVPLVHYTGVLGKSSLLVLDKSIVRTMLTAPAGKVNTRFKKPLFVFLSNTIGNGLVTLEGEDWQRHRRILQPAFKTGFLRERLNTVVPSSISRFLKSWQVAAESGREIDASSHISALTLDIVGEVAFSHNFKGLNAVEEWATKTSSENESLVSLDDAFMSSLSRVLKLNESHDHRSYVPL